MPLTADAAERLIEHTGGNPLHLRAVLRELPATGSWLTTTGRCPCRGPTRSWSTRSCAAARRTSSRCWTRSPCSGVRAPAHAALPLAALADPLATVDRAVEHRPAAGRGARRRDVARVHASAHTGGRARGDAARAAIAAPRRPRRRSRCHPTRRCTIASRRTPAPTRTCARSSSAPPTPDARAAPGSSAIRLLLAARRVTAEPAERERLTLDAIEALLYSGDGGAARRLAEQSSVAPGARRDSVWAYLAIFAGDLDAAEQLLERAWEHRGDDARLAATIAQRRAFMASSRLRGADAIEWARRAIALAPGRHRHGAARGAVAGQRAGLRRARRRGPRGARPLAR